MKAITLNKTLLSFLLVLAVSVIYYSTLNIPFYLDDFNSIAQNALLLNNDHQGYLAFYKQRIVTYSTFLLNYQFSGLDPASFHFFNLVVHAINTILVFSLLSMLLAQVSSNSNALIVAFICALLWTLHPLNSQAVIYVVQRAVLLACFFSLLSLIFWIKAGGSNKHNLLFYSAALLCFIFAVFSKESAILLPAIWFLLDVLILKKDIKQRLTYFVGALVAILLLSLGALAIVTDNVFQFLDSATRPDTNFTRLEYFLAQPKIIATYLYKLIWPSPLLLEYPFVDKGTLASAWPWLILHLAIILVAILFVKKNALLAFGVFFYYIMLAVESSIIPLRDLAFEHRVYFPNIGIAIIFASILLFLFERLDNKRVIVVSAIFVSLVLGFLTHERLKTWSEPISFYKSNLEHSPDNARLNYNVGTSYFNAGDFVNAEPYFRKAFFLAWQQQLITYNYAQSLLQTFINLGKNKEAEAFAKEVVKAFNGEPQLQSKIITVYSQIFLKRKECEAVLKLTGQALQLWPKNPDALKLKAICSG